MTTPAPRPAVDTRMDRFLAKTQQSENGCLLWSAATVLGYGFFQHAYRQTWRAHIWAWVHIGKQSRHELHHTCEIKNCVEWTHLVVLTRAEHALVHGNNANAAKTECEHGHPLSGTNLYVYGKQRLCKTCRARRLREMRLRRKEVVAA